MHRISAVSSTSKSSSCHKFSLCSFLWFLRLSRSASSWAKPWWRVSRWEPNSWEMCTNSNGFMHSPAHLMINVWPPSFKRRGKGVKLYTWAMINNGARNSKEKQWPQEDQLLNIRIHRNSWRCGWFCGTWIWVPFSITMFDRQTTQIRATANLARQYSPYYIYFLLEVLQPGP